MAQMPVEQDYQRMIPPVVDEEDEPLSAEDAALAGGDVTEQDDGTAIVSLPEVEKDEQTEHFANLVDDMDTAELSRIATDILEKIDQDKEDRKKRDEQYAEGIKRTGLGGEAPGGASFAGASKVAHPVLAEACVDFSSRAIKELFPADGPVKTKIMGKVTQQKADLANRQRDFLNWQLTDDVDEYPIELEQLLTQLPLGGSQYMKFWPQGKTWTCEFVPVDYVYLPASCNSFYKSPRVTQYMPLTEDEFNKRVEDGLYYDWDLRGSNDPTTTEAQQATDKVEGKSRTTPDVDAERGVYEVKILYEISVDDDETRPYLITIDETSQKVLSIYRNWEEEDDEFQGLDWLIDWTFLHWRGAQGIGLIHLIGGLTASATGALRALLDTAHANNALTLLMLKGTGVGGQNTQPTIGGATEIEAPVGVDDIRKVMMTAPFAPPSPVLFALLGWLTDAAKGVVTTSEEKIADASNNMPVGTTLALIEQGSKVYSAIHRRLHRAQRKCLQVIGRLNKQLPIEERQKKKLGEILATQKDFGKPLAVIPVSDPDIFSESQRFAQVQFAMQLSAVSPDLYNRYELNNMALRQAKMQDIDKILPPPKQPKELNAVAENLAASMGQPIIAFPDQNHMAHILVHLQFLMDPMLGGNPLVAQKVTGPLMQHIMEHVCLLYANSMHDLTSSAIGVSIGQLMGDQQDPNDPDQVVPAEKGIQAKVDQLLAAASKVVHASMQQQFQAAGQLLNKFAAKVVEMQQASAPMDPSQVQAQAVKVQQKAVEVQGQAVAVQGQEVQRKVALDKQEGGRKSAVDQGKLALDAQAEAHDTALQQQKQAQEAREGDAGIVIDGERVELERQHQALELVEASQPGNQVPGA